MNYDGENSDENHAFEREFSEEVQTGYGKKNIHGVEDLSRHDLTADASWEDKEEKSENHLLSSAYQDPLVESVLTLQSVQEALESEVTKLGELGKASGAPVDSIFSHLGIHESSSSDQFGSANVSLLESQVSTFTEDVQILESKLEEAKAMLNVKQSRIAELEATLNTRDVQDEKSKKMDTELEGLFKQRMEAEVEYLVLTRTVQKLRVAAGDQITLFEEQEALAGEQAKILNKLGDAECKAAILKKEAEHLEEYCADFIVTKEVMKLQKRVCKVTSYFLTQVLLLILGFWLLLLQLSPLSRAIVPT